MFRFTIRDVLWLTVVVALGVAWGLSHGQLRAARQHEAEQSRLIAKQRAGIQEAEVTRRGVDKLYHSLLQRFKRLESLRDEEQQSITRPGRTRGDVPAPRDAEPARAATNT